MHCGDGMKHIDMFWCVSRDNRLVRSDTPRNARHSRPILSPAADLRGQEISTLELYGHILGNVRNKGLDNGHEDEGDPLYNDE